jgi:hypothetical protein
VGDFGLGCLRVLTLDWYSSQFRVRSAAMKQLYLFPLLVLLVLCFSARTANADTVVLTSGTASTLAGFGSVNLAGPNFSLTYFGEIPPGATTTFFMNTVTAGSGMVSFDGVSASIFTGSLSFTNSILTGNVSAYTTMEDLFFGNPAIFTVNFTGSGFMTVSAVPAMGTRRQFDVAAVPEPVTFFLLATGLGGIAALKRKRS